MEPNGLLGRSGGAAAYQLVKYKVERVCQGTLNNKQVLVDHLILTGDELEGVKAGDLLCLAVKKSNRIPTISYAHGIREEGEKVKTFFIGWTVKKSVEPCACLRD